MEKLYKVVLGKPTGGNNYVTFNFGDSCKLIKSEYFVSARTFNEAGKLVMAHITKVIEEQKSTIRVTEFGFENLEESYTVCKIELISDELVSKIN